MQIINNEKLIVRTRHPSRITQAIQNSKPIGKKDDVTSIEVAWGLEEAISLRKLNIKNVPSPILKDYDWPGLYAPMAHQRETSSFLSVNRRAFCFNEQGTGKTASGIWASDYLMNQGRVDRVLIICPLSIMQSAWQADLFKFAVHRTINIAYGTRNKRIEAIESACEYLIINYDGIETVKDELKNGGFNLVIVDEANAYKNHRTKRFKALRHIVNEHTWIWMMTGTPAAQSPVDAYGLAKMCVPDRCPVMFGAFKDSVMYQLTRFKWVPKPNSEKVIHQLLQPAIRFSKEDCLDLPDMTYVSRYAPLSAQQNKYYKELKKNMLIEAAGEEVTAANAASNITKLLQIAGGAAEDLFAKMGMNPEEALAWGETTAEAIGRGPASAITGGSLSERVSLDPKNLWWRDGRTGSTTRENVIEDVIANAGPVVGLGFNWIDAIDLFNEGKYQRAFEKAAPAIVSKPVAAARIEEEGPRTRSGVLQTDNFSAWELAMQAVGLQPERLAQAQKSSIEAKRYEQSVLNKRNALLDRLWLERGNSDNFNEILQEAMKFSVRHPNIAITPEVIQDSFERRTKGAAEADAIGGKFDKRMLPEVLQMMRYGK